MKVIKRRPKTADCTDKDLSPKSAIADPKPVSKDIGLGTQAARRKQFMREYKKLFKKTKRFVIVVLKQNSDGFIKKGGIRVR